MQWILVLYFAFNSGGYHQGGGGGIALDHIEFYSRQQCEEAGEKILESFNTINGLHYQTRNRKYICIHRGLPDTTNARIR